VSWRLSGLESGGVGGHLLVMIERLKLGRWHVFDGAVETAMIPLKEACEIGCCGALPET
jgi:hypothetical protein